METGVIQAKYLPALLLVEWIETKKTLHLYLQIVGKKILPRPYELEPDIPFGIDYQQPSYDRKHLTLFWKILPFVHPVLKEFSGSFIGKCSPVHLFQHSFNIAVTRFSGRKAPESPGANNVNAAANTHEVLGTGFWLGDDNVREPSFYSYTLPAPDGTIEENLLPIVRYTEDIRKETDPKKALLQFLESSCVAGGKRSKWDIDAKPHKNTVDSRLVLSDPNKCQMDFISYKKNEN